METMPMLLAKLVPTVLIYSLVREIRCFASTQKKPVRKRLSEVSLVEKVHLFHQK